MSTDINLFEEGVHKFAQCITKKYEIPEKDINDMIEKTIRKFYDVQQRKNGKCIYKPARGRFANKVCDLDVLPGTRWCSKHPNGMSAIAAKKAGIKTVESVSPEFENNKYGNWVHIKSGLVFKCENSNKVIGFQDGYIINQNLTDNHLKICKQNGWKVNTIQAQINEGFNLRVLKKMFSPKTIDDIQLQIDKYRETMVYRRMTLKQIVQKISEIENVKVENNEYYFMYDPYDDVFYWSPDHKKVNLIQFKIDPTMKFEISEWGNYESGFDVEMINLNKY